MGVVSSTFLVIEYQGKIPSAGDQGVWERLVIFGIYQNNAFRHVSAEILSKNLRNLFNVYFYVSYT